MAPEQPKMQAQSMKAELATKLNPYRYYILIIVLMGIFMGVLDTNVVNIALPTITSFYGVDVAQSQWIITAYLLANTSLLLVFGRISDATGKTKLFMAGFGLFVVSSLLCGLSTSMTMLIVCRAIQGIGASMVFSISTAIIVLAFPAKERGSTLGFIGTTVAMGSIVGPILGGFIVDALGWQYLFYINVPIGIVLLAMAFKFLKIQETTCKLKLDYMGAAGLIVFMTSMMLLLSDIADSTELTLTKGIYAAVMAVSFIFFIYTERKHASPILDLAIFKVKKFSFANISSMISFIVFSMFIVSMPFYLEIVMGYKPSQVGMTLIFIPLMTAFMSPISGWLYDKLHSTFHSSLGLLVTSIALFGMGIFTYSRQLIPLMACMALLGLGSGLFNSPNNTEVMSSLPMRKSGEAGSTLATVRNFGNAIGVSLASIMLYMFINATGTSVQIIDSSPDLLAVAVSGLLLIAGAMTLVGVGTSLMVKYHYLVFKDKPEDKIPESCPKS